jgi:hypothetical protein
MPRLFTSMSGWGVGVFTEGHYFFWIPLVAPFIGALLSSFVYSIFIRNHWPIDEKHDDEEDSKNEDNDERTIQIQYSKRS